MYLNLKDCGIAYNQAITKKDIHDNKELQKKVVGFLQNIFQQSRDYMSTKTADFMRLDQQERNTIRDGKIKSQDMHTARKMYAANFAREGLYPVFDSDYSDVDLARDLTKVAKYDQDKMGLTVKFKDLTDNIFNYGAGIVIKDYVDDLKKVVDIKVFSPLNYYPDPSANYIDQNFRRHMFGIVATKDELQEVNERAGEKVYMEIDDLTPGDTYDTQWKNMQNKQIRDYNYVTSQDDIFLLRAFIEINGVRYDVTVGNACNLIIRWEQLQPLTKSERSNKCSVPYPVSVIEAYPISSDILGVSPRELMFDFANAINKIVNSTYNKEMRNAGADIYFVDSKVNLANVANRDASKPLFVPYDNFSTVPQPMVKGSEFADTTSAMNFYNWLKNRAQENTGITDITMGNPDQNNTLGQMNQQLTQSEIMFGLDIDMICEGMKTFWKNIWLRGLRENIGRRTEKYVSINGYMGNSTVIKLKSEDLVGADDPEVLVISKRKKDKENRQKLAQMQAFYTLEQADVNSTKIVLKNYKRDMYRKAGFEEDEVMAYCPIDANERHCINIMNVVNSLQEPKVPIIPGLDLQTLRFYLSMCIDSPIKTEQLRRLNLLMIEEGIEKPQEQTDQMNGLQNSMASQMVSNNLSSNMQGGANTPPAL